MTAAPAYTVQIVVDAHDPHTLADWWAQALGWSVEPQDEAFIRSMIEESSATEAETLTHRGALVWALGAAVSHPDGTGVAPRILFQRVPEAKTVKNRVHIDLRQSAGVVPGELARLVELGATRIGGGRQGPLQWAVLTDPEGNEFCLPIGDD